MLCKMQFIEAKEIQGSVDSIAALHELRISHQKH